MSKKIDDNELVEITGGADRIIDVGQGDSVKAGTDEGTFGNTADDNIGGGSGGTGIGSEGSNDGNQSL